VAASLTLVCLFDHDMSFFSFISFSFDDHSDKVVWDARLRA
jgi:hypothetical protein